MANELPVASGVTPSERYLARVARRAVLSLWSYPNLYTDEGRTRAQSGGREICDLLVVFGNDILLFSDKHCEFLEHESVKIAWSRWYRRAVQKSVNQLFGAELWLRRFPDRVFLDKQCTQLFPIPIPELDKARFHRIAVTRGSYTKCAEFFGGRSTGSLVIHTGVQGAEHLDTPFTVGLVDPKKGYVHVFDEFTLDVVLNELDTISDLVEYLRKKEVLLTKPGRAVAATGEEQLVAMYLTHMDRDNITHDFVEIPDHVTLAGVGEGHFEGFVRNPQYRAKKIADQVSYVWDNLIEHFIAHARHDPDDNFSRRNLERALRVLASEPRTRRRALANDLLGAVGQDVRPGQRFVRVSFGRQSPFTAYVFLVWPQPDYIKTYEEYHEARRHLLLIHCKIAKLRVPAADRIIGIAVQPIGMQEASEDLVLLETNAENWTPEHEQEAKELQAQTGFLLESRSKWEEKQIDEYPDS